MDYLTTNEISTLWGISSRRITTLCKEGRVEGALLKGNTWLIPATAAKPTAHKRGRKSANKENTRREREII